METTGIKLSLLPVKTPDEVQDDIVKTQEKEKTEAVQNKPVILNLSAYITRAWNENKDAKVDIETELLYCMRQRRGEYDPDDLTKIQAMGGTDIFMMITGMKCRAVESWISDVMLLSGERPWSIHPTPRPDLPQPVEQFILQQLQSEVTETTVANGPDSVTLQEVIQRKKEIRDEVEGKLFSAAKETARRQEDFVDDVLVQGGFYDEMRLFIRDFSEFPTAFLKGPIVQRKKRMVWEDASDGRRMPTFKDELISVFKRVSPFDIYPSPGARSLDDGNLIERILIRPNILQECIGVPGFNNASIRTVLEQHEHGKLKGWLWTDSERADLDYRANDLESNEPIIEALVFHGEVQGKMLIEWGMDTKEVPDKSIYYPVKAWLIGQYVVMARINHHPLGKRGYYCASFEQANDSIWGRAVPYLMRDCQRACNATARSMINNMAIASGPQVEVNTDRLGPGEDPEDIFPWKIWRTRSDPTSSGKPAVNFWQPNMMTNQLMQAYQYFFEQASEQSGVPHYIYGNANVGGAGQTASGLSMLMNAASKTMKNAIMNIDLGVIKPLVEYVWMDQMTNNKKMPIDGDIAIRARASDTLLIAEMLSVRRMEWLKNTANPVDMQIIGVEGRAKVLRESARGLHLGTDVVPSAEEIKKMQASMQAAQEAAAQAAQTPDAQALNPDGSKAGVVEGVA